MSAPAVANSLCSHAPEFSLAVSACMWPESETRADRVAACLDRTIDWTLFLRVVARHRIAGLVNHALAGARKERVPAEAMLSLKQCAAAMAVQGLRAAIETHRLATTLSKAAIPCIVLKGAPLAMLAYGNVGLRHSKDIDLLVSPQDMTMADEVIQAAGYVRLQPAPSSDRRQVESYLRNRHDFEYVHRQTGQALDLSGRLNANPAFGPQIDVRDAHGPWQCVEVGGGMRLDTLGSDDLLPYLCAHGSMHSWHRLKWLADIGALLAQSPDAAARLLEIAHSQGTHRSAQQAVWLCHRFWGTPLPPRMPAASWQVQCLVRVASSAMTAGDAATELRDQRIGTTQVSLSHYLASSKPRYLLHQLRYNLFPPDERERLPAPIRFLFPLLRWPMWIARKLRLPGDRKS